MSDDIAVRVKEALRDLSRNVEDYLASCLEGRDIPDALRRSMEYSLLAGGKRLRPCLCLAWAELCGMKASRALPFASSIECIHTYSLVHDDLPAMDDDDMRRGKPSNHKQFGEATAILAGDGLLTEAFLFMTRADAEPAHVLEAVAVMARAAGAEGMVGGQVLDMEYTGRVLAAEGNPVTLDQLRTMHAMKTGALIRASCEAGAVLACGGEDRRRRAAAYGAHLGRAFQIVDDILDEVGDEKSLGKPVGSDRDKGKTTYVSLVGLERSRELAEEATQQALQALDGFRDADKSWLAFLQDLARYVLVRAV
ncbi:polyprenyl synthetase family protein [Oceanidesulfovibrio indonesiensis]|uniref:Polyprenyl synthetase family protein n=1 Tax=Oceanidesulfovibrio indonesiensis TaxID=54767 RepID=A0A7M3MGL6_9BACT|nr:farnesyl diphosphate synthase [Oceanidesulfovibrio indonesiensis]TVM18247.1 polyprenyl synthetase family protein [Oceanidesulfovibrio indonesiensis]